jgi:hypothetical protein
LIIVAKLITCESEGGRKRVYKKYIVRIFIGLWIELGTLSQEHSLVQHSQPRTLSSSELSARNTLSKLTMITPESHHRSVPVKMSLKCIKDLACVRRVGKGEEG